jgi:hypothetical protein
VSDTQARRGADTQRRGGRSDLRRGAVAEATEFKDLVVAYARQETVEPLRNLGHDLAFGISGAVCIATGILFAMLALLRGLQELSVFNDPSEVAGGRFSWAPYTIVAVVGTIVAAIFLRQLVRFVQRRPQR